MCRNPGGCPTIEGELLDALVSTRLLTEAECIRTQSVNFQRAARTDKGVSAARQVISVKLPISELVVFKYFTSILFSTIVSSS